jgi:hypothetical protein
MENVLIDDSMFRICEIASIATAKDFAPYGKSAAKLRPSTPVLTSSCELDLLKKYARHDGAGCFGFGCIHVDDCPLLTMRLQIGALQIYWLADPSDPELWKTIDLWKKVGQAGFALAQGSNVAFFSWDMRSPQTGMTVEQFRGECGRNRAWEFMQCAASLAGSGRIQLNATTDIPGVRLEHVLVNILMTERLERVAKARSLGQLANVPAFWRPSGASVH